MKREPWMSKAGHWSGVKHERRSEDNAFRRHLIVGGVIVFAVLVAVVGTSII